MVVVVEIEDVVVSFFGARVVVEVVVVRLSVVVVVVLVVSLVTVAPVAPPVAGEVVVVEVVEVVVTSFIPKALSELVVIVKRSRASF